MIKDIKHFEIRTDMEAFKNALRSAENEIIKDHSNLLRKYIINNLKGELERKDTKNVPCARIYYNEANQIAGIKIYYNQNLIFSQDFGLGQERPQSDSDKTKKTRKRKILKKRKECRSKMPEEHSFIVNRPDIEKICTKLSETMLKIVEKDWILDQQRIRIFKKIPCSLYDLHMRNPEENFRDMDYFWKVEHILYAQGYKLLEEKYIDVDGVVALQSRWLYDENGMLKRVEYSTEAPWREFIICRINNCYYNFENHLVSCEEFIYMEKDDSDTPEFIRFYQLDNRNFLSEYRIYKKCSDGNPENPPFAEVPNNMTLLWKVRYKTDKLGRVVEYQIENLDMIDYLFVAPKKRFEYDSENRISCVKAYNKANKLITLTKYEYLNPNQYKMVVRFKKRKIPLIESICLLSRCSPRDAGF